jgi:hypothetical protein
MYLKFNKVEDFFKVWKEDFFGQRGLFLPVDKRFGLGQAVSIQIFVKGEDWGKIEVLSVWANIHGPEKEDIPRGIFLRLIKAESEFERKLAAVK